MLYSGPENALLIKTDTGYLDARAMLASLTDQPPAVNEAAATAVTAIDRMLQLWGLVQGIFYGLSLGSVLLLAAAGLAITFGVMGIINMAHGEMVIQPSIIKDIGRIIDLLRTRGDMAILLVEQYFDFARDLASRIAVMDRGDIVLNGRRDELDEADVRRRVSV